MSKFKESSMHAVFFLSALSSVLVLGLISHFLFTNGLPAMKEIGLRNLLLGKEWSPIDAPPMFGVLPMILGSLYIMAGAVFLGGTVGVLTAAYLAFADKNGIYSIIKPAIDLLAGIPSVVYGFFGLNAIVPHFGSSILSASLLLGIMILPTVINIAEGALRAVPPEYYEGAVALGAGHHRSIFTVVIPSAKSGLLTAIVLGVGRSIGETMAVIMVAGNQARVPTSLFRGVRTLTANIAMEMGYAVDLHRGALMASGVILFAFILLINLGASALKRSKM